MDRATMDGLMGRTIGASRTSGRGWSGPEYHVRARFRAPLAYVFAWCTDYTPADAKLEGEDYARRILERTPRRVVLEDLEDTPDGWNWSRGVVRLRPPNRWRMDAIGNFRDVRADYVLSNEGKERTVLDLRWKVRRHRGPNRSRAERERSGTAAWRKFAAALEKDFRRAHPGHRK